MVGRQVTIDLRWQGEVSCQTIGLDEHAAAADGAWFGRSSMHLESLDHASPPAPTFDCDLMGV